MKIAVVFDTSRASWEDADFKREVAAHVEEAEYEVAEALMDRGHDVCMVGVQTDLKRMIDTLRGYAPDLVFNCTEAFEDNAAHQARGADRHPEGQVARALPRAQRHS